MDEKQRAAYRVLNLPESATQQEIRAAYEKLEERYSEMRYLGSPLWDMAAEKRELIRRAYGELREDRCSTEPPVAKTEQTEPASTPSVSRQLRMLLNENKLDAAQTLLCEQPDAEQEPELLYLRGMLAWKRGWIDEAMQYLERALHLCPKNQEYKAAREKLTGSLPPAVRRKHDRDMRRSEDRFSGKGCAACTGECLCEVCSEGICEFLCDGC